MKVKICGITKLEDAKLAYELGADAIGFIFYEKSKRYIEPKKAKEIMNQLPVFLLRVGVFVNESAKEINEIARDIKLNLIQLHGEEPAEMIYDIELPVIKAFRVNENFDYSILSKYKNCSFLLDAYNENEYGGTGQKFNWRKIPSELKEKIILAGGISENNVEQIYKEVNPYAIDVSSSIEIEQGKKDHFKIKQLFQKIYELRKA
jgi:phosphoribosylanthranilate isomerase